MERQADRVPAYLTLAMDGRSGSAATARAQAGSFLSGLSEPPLTSARISDALILISELVTNATRHAPGPCVLNMVYDGTTVFIAVSDSSPELPRPRPADLHTGTGGFGWNLLTHLTENIHITRHAASRKTIVTALSARPA